MNWVAVKEGCDYRVAPDVLLEPGMIFQVSDVEIDNFGDKLMVVDDPQLIAKLDQTDDSNGINAINATRGAAALAAELEVDLAPLVGSGTDGKITVPDVRGFVTSLETAE